MNTTTVKPARVRARKSNADIVPAIPKSLERGIKAHEAIVTSVKRVTTGARTVGSGVASGVASGACAVGNFFKGLVKGV